MIWNGDTTERRNRNVTFPTAKEIFLMGMAVDTKLFFYVLLATYEVLFSSLMPINLKRKNSMTKYIIFQNSIGSTGAKRVKINGWEYPPYYPSSLYQRHDHTSPTGDPFSDIELCRPMLLPGRHARVLALIIIVSYRRMPHVYPSTRFWVSGRPAYFSASHPQHTERSTQQVRLRWVCIKCFRA